MDERFSRLALVAACVMAVIGPTAALAQTLEEGGSGGDGLSLVGLGDSLPGQAGGYVEMLGVMVSEALGQSVAVTNLATNDGVGSDGLLTRVRDLPEYRDAIAGADIITLQVGRNDWQEVCYAPNLQPCLTEAQSSVEANLDAILTEIESLRAGSPTAIRVLDYYNAEVGDPALPPAWDFEDTPEATEAFNDAYIPLLLSFNEMICQVASAHDAVCIDILPAFNGVDARDDAGRLLQPDHVHPNATGSEVVAQLVAATGFVPLE